MKFNIGDEVWIKATIITTDEADKEFPYEIRITEAALYIDDTDFWVSEKHLKGSNREADE